VVGKELGGIRGIAATRVRAGPKETTSSRSVIFTLWGKKCFSGKLQKGIAEPANLLAFITEIGTRPRKRGFIDGI